MRAGKNVLLLVLAGLVWGGMETILGGYLHLIHSPFKGPIMMGIGLSIIGLYIARSRKIWHPLWIGLIAAGVKLGSAFILGIPLLSRGIINPAVAIIVEAASISAVMGIAARAFRGNWPLKKLVY